MTRILLFSKCLTFDRIPTVFDDYKQSSLICFSMLTKVSPQYLAESTCSYLTRSTCRGFFILSLLFPSLFMAVLTATVFFPGEKNKNVKENRKTIHIRVKATLCLMKDKLWVRKFCIRHRMSLNRDLQAPLKGRGNL